VNSSPNRTDLERFLAATESGRSGFSLDDVLVELESLVHRDAEKVVKAAPQIASHARSIKQGGQAARALRSSATATAYLGRHQEALRLSRDARQLALDFDEPVEAARALVAGMQPLCETGRVEEAIADGEKARDELESTDQDQLAARVDLNLGNVHKMRGDADRALFHLDRVIEVLPREDPIHPHALNAVGECRYILDDHDGADTAFRDALELLGEDAGFAGGLILGNRADVASREGRLQEAIDLFAEARKCLEEQGATTHAARLVVESAEVLEVAGLRDESMAELEKGLESITDSGMPFENARARYALGRLLVHAGRYNQAIERFDQARDLFSTIDNQRYVKRTTLAAVEACIAGRRHDDAGRRLESVRDRIDGPFEVSLFAHHDGLFHEAEGRLDLALSCAENACLAASELGIRPLSVDLAARRCQLLVRTGAFEDALRIGREATEEIERIRSTFHGERLRAAFLASRLSAHEAYVGALLACGGEDNLQVAFETVEKARNRGLTERINRQLQGSTDKTSDDPTTLRLKKRLNALYAALVRDGFEDQRRMRAGNRQREIDALELQLDRHLLDVDQNTLQIDHPITYGDITDALDKRTALIEFFVIDDDLIVFVVFDGHLEVRVKPGVMMKVDELISEFHFQCRRRLRGNPGPQLEERMDQSCIKILQELHSILLGNDMPTLTDARRLLVIPFGSLVSVPFHALHDGENYLIDSVTVATAPSAASAISLSRVQPSGSGALIASIADEMAPTIRNEGEAIAAQYADVELVVRLDGEQATAEQLKKALTRVRIAHIACHGRFLSGSPRSSGLRMSDRWLTVRDIHDLPSTPSIVVLSGCETGLNPCEGADELHGLTRGFTANGTTAVVASLWSVQDEASTRLMTRMHRRLAATRGTPHGVAEALRQAQLELREELPHPAFWAAFICSESTIEDTNQEDRNDRRSGGEVTCTN
jgi:CHAT domain-containing protein